MNGQVAGVIRVSVPFRCSGWNRECNALRPGTQCAVLSSGGASIDVAFVSEACTRPPRGRIKRMPLSPPVLAPVISSLLSGRVRLWLVDEVLHGNRIDLEVQDERCVIAQP